MVTRIYGAKPTRPEEPWESRMTKDLLEAWRGFGYFLVSPIEGVVRGARGRNTPLPVRDILIENSDDYRLTSIGETIYSSGRYPNTLGGGLATFFNVIGAIPATPTWAATRLFRAWYDAPSYVKARLALYSASRQPEKQSTAKQ